MTSKNVRSFEGVARINDLKQRKQYLLYETINVFKSILEFRWMECRIPVSWYITRFETLNPADVRSHKPNRKIVKEIYVVVSLYNVQVQSDAN